MEQDLISVIVPVYNVEEYLDECVESIVNQTYKNLEIILVDDGSTDGCPQICDAWAKRDSRIKVIHKENGGLSDARNAGIDIMHGKYVTFVDSDDCLEVSMIEYLNFLREKLKNADIVMCDAYHVDENGMLESVNGYIRRYEDVFLLTNDECMRFCMRDKRYNTVAWAKLYKASLFTKIRFPFGKYHEDNFMTYRLIARSSKICYGGERKYVYRLTNNSITRGGFNLRHLDKIEAEEEKVKFMVVNYPMYVGMAKADVLSAVNSCLLKMIKSNYENINEVCARLRPYYRQYIWDYLTGRGHLTSKVFSLCATINFDVAVWILKLMR